MNIFKTLSLAILAFVVVSCSSSSKKSAESQEEVTEVQNITIKPNGASLKWTAYKFTAKTGVSGTFDTLNLNAAKISGTPEEILLGGSLSIPTSSVNSNNVIRDPKIKKSFFGVFNTPVIDGKFVSAKDGRGQIELKMNGLAANTSCTYALNDTALVVSAALNVMAWNGGTAIDSLNAVCSALHTGEDGTSKLWPDVDVTLSLPLVK